MRVSTIMQACAALAVCLTSTSALSQMLEKREPGLWEVQITKGSPLDAVMKTMQSTLDKLPAAQRKQMEQMMAKQGVSATGPSVIKQCVTPAMAAREFEPHSDDPKMKCTNTTRKVSGNEATYSFSCQSDEGKWNGQGRIWDATPKAYKSQVTMAGTIEGRPMKMDMSHEGRWVGADCQGVKPAVQ